MEKKISIVILCIVLIISCFAGCKQETELPTAVDTYIAQGTIPEKAKLFPIVDENIPMEIMNKSNDGTGLSKEEIEEITTKVDKMVALTNNSGSQNYDTTELDFLYGFTNQSIYDSLAKKDHKNVLQSCQVLTITILDKTHIEAVVAYTVTTDKDSSEHIALAYIGFLKNDGKWMITGSQLAFSGKKSDYLIYRNGNGQIVYEPINKGGE